MKQAVLLINLGTPTAPTAKAVRPWLKQFLSDKRVISAPRWLWWPILNGLILPIRSKKSAKNYASIWFDNGSPLRVYSEQLTELLNQQAKPEVRLAMTYGQPSIHHQLTTLQNEGFDSIKIIPLYAQYSTTTTASIYDQVADWLKQSIVCPSIQLVSSFYQRDAYIKALAESIRPALANCDKLVFSYHGIPVEYTEKGDPYRVHCELTTQAVVAYLGLSESEYELCFQSRFGPKQWESPYFVDRVTQLPIEGKKRIAVVAPAFVVDCLETLEEIAQEGQADFMAAGGESFHYIPCLNAEQSMVDALLDIIND